jgi:signal transduction histidine kinase
MDWRIGGRIVLALAATICAPTFSTSAAAQPGSPRNVLVIHSGAETFPANPLLDAGIREVLASRPDLSIDCFSEYLESDLFPGEPASQVFSDYLRRKYQGRRIDLVIAITDVGLRFALHHRGTLFPDAPIVFTGLAGVDETSRGKGGGITGLRVGIAYAETLELALELHPSTERVFVVAHGRDSQTLEAVRAEFRDFLPRVSVAYIDEPTIPRLLSAVGAVPSGSLILYIWHTQQDPGSNVYPDEVARQVAQVAPVPVYGTSDFYVGSGVVGGVVRGTRETGTRLGEMAVRILTGTPPQEIPIEAARLVPYLDWRQMRRWGISEARVPSGAVISFKEPSAWSRYKVYVLGAATILLAQTVLIAGLLVQRSRRRQAEEQVRGSQAALLTSYERIRDLGARLLSAQETERSRIARELHDDISQQMALLEIDLELLGGAIQGDAGELAGDALARTQGISRSLHDLSHRLHPAKLRLIGLVSAIRGLQRELSQPNIEIAFTHDNVPPTLPPDVTLCLFRIVQEALHNAIKYSQARQVAVYLGGVSDSLELAIADDGVGFDVDAAWGTGLGLISMGERVEAIGGTFKVQSNPGIGTRLEVTVPLGAVEDTATIAV